MNITVVVGKTGRGLPGRHRDAAALLEHGRRVTALALLAFGLLVGSALGSGGPTGGVGVSPGSGGSSSPQRSSSQSTTSHTKAKSKRRKAQKSKDSKSKGTRRVKPKAVNDPFAGRGMWIWYVSASDGGNLTSIIADAHAYGITTLMIKAGDGGSPWAQFSSQLVSTLHANGLRVCAWQYVYGSYPASEAQVGAAAVHAGADCLLIDAESEYEGKYVAAQTYITDLRQSIGAGFPVALASFPYVDYHPGLPYSVFLGPGGAQYNTPQMYWVDIGDTVDNVYAHTMSYNQIYGRTIIPLGQVYANPPSRDIMRFRLLSRAYGTPGVSWWDWQEATTRQWKALAKPAQWLTSFTSPASAPVIGPGAKGDLVVWAQEHMLTAGYPIAITGTYHSPFATQVQAFQLAHGLTTDGVIGPLTWTALLHYAPAKVQWTKSGAQTTLTGTQTPLVHAARAGAALQLAVPGSAHLPARRDEIPPHLGAH